MVKKKETHVVCIYGCTSTCPAYMTAKQGDMRQFTNTILLFGCHEEEKHEKCYVYKMLETHVELEKIISENMDRIDADAMNAKTAYSSYAKSMNREYKQEGNDYRLLTREMIEKAKKKRNLS